MTWGPYWMYYTCPICGKKFKYELQEDSKEFGLCPVCKEPGKLVAESPNPPEGESEYNYA